MTKGFRFYNDSGTKVLDDTVKCWSVIGVGRGIIPTYDYDEQLVTVDFTDHVTGLPIMTSTGPAQLLKWYETGGKYSGALVKFPSGQGTVRFYGELDTLPDTPGEYGLSLYNDTGIRTFSSVSTISPMNMLGTATLYGSSSGSSSWTKAVGNSAPTVTYGEYTVPIYYWRQWGGISTYLPNGVENLSGYFAQSGMTSGSLLIYHSARVWIGFKCNFIGGFSAYSSGDTRSIDFKMYVDMSTVSTIYKVDGTPPAIGSPPIRRLPGVPDIRKFSSMALG